MFRVARSVSHSLGSFVRVAGSLGLDGLGFLRAIIRSRSAVTAEILFLRKQLAFYQEHQIRPRRLTDAARFSLATVQLESGIGDRQTGEPHRLASPGVQAVLAVEVAVGTTEDSGKSSPAAWATSRSGLDCFLNW